jgi:hypothetical protein
MITAISTASGITTTIVESSAAIRANPHQDTRPPKIDMKKARSIG